MEREYGLYDFLILVSVLPIHFLSMMKFQRRDINEPRRAGSPYPANTASSTVISDVHSPFEH